MSVINCFPCQCVTTRILALEHESRIHNCLSAAGSSVHCLLATLALLRMPPTKKPAAKVKTKKVPKPAKKVKKSAKQKGMRTVVLPMMTSTTDDSLRPHNLRRLGSRRMTIGTDCAGLEVVMAAFKDLGVPTQHNFSCEQKKILHEFVGKRFKPLALYADMTTRCNSDHNPGETDLDFYVAGLACQSFSAAGKNLGTTDPRGIGKLFDSALDFLQHRIPRSFMLENVKNLVVAHKKIFRMWLKNARAARWGIQRSLACGQRLSDSSLH